MSQSLWVMSLRVSAVTQTHKMKVNPNPKLLLYWLCLIGSWLIKHPFSFLLTPLSSARGRRTLRQPHDFNLSKRKLSAESLAQTGATSHLTTCHTRGNSDLNREPDTQETWRSVVFLAFGLRFCLFSSIALTRNMHNFHKWQHIC